MPFLKYGLLECHLLDLSRLRILFHLHGLGVLGDCRQEADASSSKNLGEQTSKLSSIMMAIAATTLVAASCVNGQPLVCRPPQVTD